MLEYFRVLPHGIYLEHATVCGRGSLFSSTPAVMNLCHNKRCVAYCHDLFKSKPTLEGKYGISKALVVTYHECAKKIIITLNKMPFV
jgi:hypothetical protein